MKKKSWYAECINYVFTPPIIAVFMQAFYSLNYTTSAYNDDLIIRENKHDRNFA